jgi:lysophospholipase L1-like esterase
MDHITSDCSSADVLEARFEKSGRGSIRGCSRTRQLTLAAFTLAAGLVGCESDAPPSMGGAVTGGDSTGSGGGSGTSLGGSGGSPGSGGQPAGSGAGGASGMVSTGGSGGAIGGAAGSGASGASETGGMGGGGPAGGGAGGSGAITGGMAGTASGGSGGAPVAGGGGAPACAKGVTKGSEVLLIGDSFIALSRDISEDLNTLARNAGTLEAGESYRDSSVSGTQLSGGISPQIPQQYVNAQRQGPVKVVIMDGGGNDMLNNTCSDPPTASCQAIQNAVAAVEDLFSTMGDDGVESVVYFFYPENQTNATQRAKIDVLRTLLQEVCTSAVSPKCYGVDLRPVFVGHFTEYILSDGIHPTAAGSQATAEAIWASMQQNCIAQ